MIDLVQLADRYHKVRAAIPPHVQLIAVSKTRSVEEIKALYDLGHRSFGENYPQELRDKHPFLPPDIDWHFIGNIQSNKVKYIVPAANLIHTAHSEKIIQALNERAMREGKKISVLLQVHIAQERSKHGLSSAGVMEFLDRWDATGAPMIAIRGLMGMATNTADTRQIRSEFSGLKGLFDRLRSGLPQLELTELSMGMSGDAAIAIEEGSTMVRIGTAIFGER